MMGFAANALIILVSRREAVSCFLQHGVRAFSSSSLKYATKPQKYPLTLPEQLKARIEVRGPLTIADYMRAVLTNPDGGYYMHRDVLGRQGDFTTSPEITQLFGDMVGIWFVNECNKFYASGQPLQLVELGPGRGSLTGDVLKVLKQLRGKDGLSVHLVEISPEFSRIQAEKLCLKKTIQLDNFVPENYIQTNEGGRRYSVGKEASDVNIGSNTRKGASIDAVTVIRPENLRRRGDTKHYQKGLMEDGTPVFWYYSINEVPHGFSCFLAHEFFDALPVHKFKKTAEGWREVLVTTDPERGPENFKFVISRSGTPSSKVFMKIATHKRAQHVVVLQPWDEREEAEICPDTGLIGQQIATRLEENGGAALIIDYGYEGESCDTFRAFRQHKQVDPLISPGTADLTADVDFTYLHDAVKDKTVTYGPVTQNQFLKEIGIENRLKILLDGCSEEQKSHLQSSYSMIMKSMGERFKVFAIFPNVLQDHLKKHPVAGFPKS